MDKHRGPDGLLRRGQVSGEEEEDNPKDWVDHALSLGIWIASWLGTTSMSAATTLVLETEGGDNSTQTHRPQRDRQPPTRYHTGEYIPSNPPHIRTPQITATDTDEHNVKTTHTPSPNSPTSEDTDNVEDADDGPAPVKFSSSNKANKAEITMEQIRHYLISRRTPPDLAGDALTRFISRTRRFLIADGWLWRQQGNRRHQLYIPQMHRCNLVRDTHDKLGHKGFYATHRMLLNRFWWPALETDVKWYVKTCHQCQICQTIQIHILPTVDTPAPLFRKAYIDTMFMPLARGYRYIVQARCSLTAWPEWRTLRVETGRTIGAFIFKEILCRWGAVGEIVTDNGTAYVAVLDWLMDRYGIRHIRISVYNSRANRIIECQHRTVHDSLVKVCEGDTAQWPTVAPFIFWADRATTCKSTSYSPFYMTHGVKPVLPFDITMATFLVPDIDEPLATDNLLAIRACQLEKHPAVTLTDCFSRVQKSTYRLITVLGVYENGPGLSRDNHLCLLFIFTLFSVRLSEVLDSCTVQRHQMIDKSASEAL